MSDRWLDDIHKILARDETPVDRLLSGLPEESRRDMQAVMVRADALLRHDFGHPENESTPRTFWLGVFLSVLACNEIYANRADAQRERKCPECGEQRYLHDDYPDPHCACMYGLRTALKEIMFGANWGLNVNQLREMARNALERNYYNHDLTIDEEPPEAVSA